MSLYFAVIMFLEDGKKYTKVTPVLEKTRSDLLFEMNDLFGKGSGLIEFLDFPSTENQDLPEFRALGALLELSETGMMELEFQILLTKVLHIGQSLGR